MRSIEYTAQYKRDLKRVKKRGKPLAKLVKVMTYLKNEERLPRNLKDHALKGEFIGCRECHLEPDGLLVYELIEKEKVVLFIRTGTHADLFKQIVFSNKTKV
ncbi:MAG: type II toxin-antitoxin system YafQ family toxin [Pseudomonadota bacterium]